MPEGPENQVVCNSLQHLVGGTLLSYDFNPAGARSFRNFSYAGQSMPEALGLWFHQKTPLSLLTVYRHGKRLFFGHGSGISASITNPGYAPELWFLICGMGLSGWIVTRTEDSAFDKKHNIFTLRYTTGNLHFFDLRRFGSWMLLDCDAATHWCKSNLGPDAMTAPHDTTLDVLLKAKSNPRYNHTEIKSAILDQKLISGFGNIYACEACFLSRVNPFKPLKDCTNAQVEEVLRSGRDLMNASVLRGGTSFRDFKAPTGKAGDNQSFLRVFRQKTCPACQGPISRVMLKGRGTYHCTSCQR